MARLAILRQRELGSSIYSPKYGNSGTWFSLISHQRLIDNMTGSVACSLYVYILRCRGSQSSSFSLSRNKKQHFSWKTTGNSTVTEVPFPFLVYIVVNEVVFTAIGALISQAGSNNLYEASYLGSEEQKA
jgi:hypothetical protein